MNNSFSNIILSDILWQSRSNSLVGILFTTMFFAPMFAILVAVPIFVGNFSITIGYIFILIFVLIYLFVLIQNVGNTYFLTKSELIIVHYFVFDRVQTLPLKSVLEILITQPLDNVVNVRFYYQGVDSEGFQNKVTLFGIKDVEKLIHGLDSLNEVREGKILVNIQEGI